MSGNWPGREPIRAIGGPLRFWRLRAGVGGSAIAALPPSLPSRERSITGRHSRNACPLRAYFRMLFDLRSGETSWLDSINSDHHHRRGEGKA